MFSILREISQSYEFRNFIDGFFGESAYLERQTHGVRLAVDEYWLDWWLFNQSGMFTPWLAPLIPPHRPLAALRVGSRWRAILSAMGYPRPTRGQFIAAQPPRWGQYCAARGWPNDAKPFRIILSLRPGTALGELQNMQRRTSSEGYPLEFEVRPLVRGHSYLKPAKPLVGGVSVGPGGGVKTVSGTLGGILRYQASSIALTCAHVLDGQIGDEVWHPAVSDHGRSAKIGSIKTLYAPTERSGQFCNRTASDASTSDVAIVAVDSAVDSDLSVRVVGQVASYRLIDAIGNYEDVVFVGKESDRCEARTEQLSHWQEIHIAGKVFCFRDLFTIGFRTPGYISRTLSIFGDSGAWILSDPGLGTRELLGMLIGGDGEKSFCAFAENVIKDARLVINDLVFQ